MDYIDFPPLPNNYNYDDFFRDELVFFHFHSTRAKNYTDFCYFSNRFDNVLDVLKKQLHLNPQNNLPYLQLFYKLIANTRDIHSGKGERDFSYMMLWKLYKYFPSLSTYLLYRFVKQVPNQPYTYGCWKDIKYFCDFIYSHSSKKENDPLITICVELINTQLKDDLQTWKFSEHAMDPRFISNVAKWIPRENKKFSWLFDLLAIHWGVTNHPHIMNTANNINSQIKASNKYKLLYRKNVSYMNKAIDPLEIKLCANRIHLIEPSNITLCNMDKHKHIIFNDSDNPDKISCSQRIKDYIIHKYSNCKHDISNFYKYNTSSSLPIYYYVKNAISFIEKYDCADNSEYQILNKQWDYLSDYIFDNNVDNFILPIIDISSSMRKHDDDSFYAAIGYAILLSQHSFLHDRILAIDNVPIWIKFEPNMTFIQKVKVTIQNISSLYSTESSYTDAFHFIGRSLLHNNLSYNDIEKLQFVVFSTFSQFKEHDANIYDLITDTLSSYTKARPYITFWNLSKYDNIVIPSSANQAKTKLLSGFSSHLVDHLPIHSNIEYYTPYTSMCKILNRYQYNVLDEYIHNIIV